MGQAKQRRERALAIGRFALDIVCVGCGGLCGECEEIHPLEPYPFAYTVGCTSRSLPELIIVGSSAPLIANAKAELGARYHPATAASILGEIIADNLDRKLRALVSYQAGRARPLRHGEHVHALQTHGLDCCVQLAEMPPPDRRRFSAAP